MTSSRRPRLVLWLLPALFSARVLAVCPQDELTGSPLGTYIPEASGEAVLIRLQQFQTDLKLAIDDGSSQWFNSPGGRFSRDYLMLERNNSGTFPGLCIYSVLRQLESGPYDVEEIPLPAASGETLSVLRQLNRASQFWQAGGRTSISESATLYRDVANRLPGLIQLSQSMEFDLQLGAIIAAIQNGQRQQGLADAELLADNYSSEPELAFKALALAGSMQLSPGNLVRGIPLLEQALSKVTQAETEQGISLDAERSEILINLGEGHITAGQLDEADDDLQQALALAGNDYNLLARVHNNMGYLFIRRGETPGLPRSERTDWMNRSLEAHLDGIDYSRLAGNREMQRLVESNTAVHYVRIGELRNALSHFKEVLGLLDDETPNPVRAFFYSTLGDYYQILGEYNNALSYFEESLSLVEDPALSNPRNTNLPCRIGTVHRLLGNIDEAATRHRECIQLAESVNDYLSIVEGYLQLSEDEQARGNLEEAEKASDKSLEYLPQISDQNYARRSRTQHASVLLAMGELEPADAEISQALQLEQNERHPDNYVATVLQAVRIKRARGLSDEAIALGKQAQDFSLQIHTQLEAERLGPSWSNLTNAVFNEVADLYLELYDRDEAPADLEQALFTYESSRDISLRQQLAAGLDHDAVSLEEQKQLERYSRISNQLASTGGLENAPRPTSVEYYYQHDLLSLARLQDRESLSVPDALHLDEIQSLLEPGQMALYYIINADTLHMLAITSRGVETREIPFTGELNQLLLQAENQLHTPGALPGGGLLRLSSILLPDLTEYPDISELLVVDNDILQTFPFAALSFDPDTYTPLVSRYAVTAVPSLSVYFMDKPERTVPFSSDVAVFADPVFRNMQLAAAEVENPGGSVIRGWSENLQRLPFTAQEAGNIKAMIPSALTYTGNRATRANLASDNARNARILHIATHGYFNSSSEDNIGLALSTVDEQAQPDPGFITLSELFGYTFNNELVVISGCETAMGQSLAGVGMNGLTRGFLAQGASHVISTLWPVGDRATAEFMRLFYQRLVAHDNVNLALQEAQREFSRRPEYSHPFYWAAYVLTSVSKDSQLDLEAGAL